MKVFWCARYTELGGIQTTTKVKAFTRLKDAKTFMLNRFGYIERLRMGNGRIKFKFITYCNGFTPSVDELQRFKSDLKQYHNIKIDTTNMDEFVKAWDDYLIKEMLDEKKG